MATTTNYGWTTPDDTALVKDGASAIRTLGTSVDTTTKNLNPSTTLGDIEYRSSTSNTNTRVGIGSSGQALTVVAGVPSWAASATSVLTTTGDTLYASAANTLTRRAIGSTGDVLTVSGGLPTWAAPASGGMTLISTTTMSGTTTTISSIPQTYVSLYLIITGVTSTGAGNENISMYPNGVTNLFSYSGTVVDNTTFTSERAVAVKFSPGGSALKTSDVNAWQLQIDNYTSTTNYKQIYLNGHYTTAADNFSLFALGTFKSNTAISSLGFYVGGNTFATGTILLYGVK